MNLRIVVRLLEEIVNSPEDPGIAIDSFLHAYWLNGNGKAYNQGEVWLEIFHLANELENYEPNPEIRKYGFCGPARAVAITRRTLNLINCQSFTRPSFNTEEHDRRR